MPAPSAAKTTDNNNSDNGLRARTRWLRPLLAVTVLVQLGLAAPAVRAQTYPDRPIKIVVGFPPGSSGDLLSRAVGGRLSQMLGQQFIIENRPGASSSIAAEAAARAPQDGYTLFLGTVANVVNAAITPKLAFDFSKDFAPIGLAAVVPVVLVVHPSIHVDSLKGLIELAKSKPGKLFYASSGVATTPHLAGALLNARAGINIVHVPYQGAPPAVTDLLAGRTQVMFAAAASVMPHVKAGKLKALAWAAPKRGHLAPDLPTVGELGMPDLDASIWFGLMAPVGTPQPVIDRLNRELNAALKSPELLSVLSKQGYEPLGGTPQDFTRYIAAELKKWKAAAQIAGVKK
jgi:tripartite-type tricarboxylate transporter receptor subunit TctC